MKNVFKNLIKNILSDFRVEIYNIFGYLQEFTWPVDYSNFSFLYPYRKNNPATQLNTPDFNVSSRPPHSPFEHKILNCGNYVHEHLTPLKVVVVDTKGHKNNLIFRSTLLDIFYEILCASVTHLYCLVYEK